MSRGTRAWLPLLLPTLAALACASEPTVDPAHRPAENVLEVIAVLRRHVPDDTYRFPPARDFTQRNVYRSSLLRLENAERAHARAFRAGHMDGVIAFAKGRALERLRAYDLAAGEYRLAAEREDELGDEALRSASICDSLHELTRSEPGLTDVDPRQTDLALELFDERAAKLEALLESADGTHYVPVIREEIERNDQARAQYFVALRRAVPDGDLRAVSEMQRLVLAHPESKNEARHLLHLGGLYENLAREYAANHPPESLHFDPVRFQELVDSGARIYEMVSQRDGTPEKIEAKRRLEAFIAFALRIDRDRFTP